MEEQQHKVCDDDLRTKTQCVNDDDDEFLEPIEPKFASRETVRQFLRLKDLVYFDDPPGIDEAYSGILRASRYALDLYIPEAKYAVEKYNTIKNANLEFVAIEKIFTIMWGDFLSHMTLTVKDNDNGGKQSTYLACVWADYDGYVLGIFLEKDDKVLPFLKRDTSKKRPRDAPKKKKLLQDEDEWEETVPEA